MSEGMPEYTVSLYTTVADRMNVDVAYGGVGKCCAGGGVGGGTATPATEVTTAKVAKRRSAILVFLGSQIIAAIGLKIV